MEAMCVFSYVQFSLLTNALELNNIFHINNCNKFSYSYKFFLEF